MALGSYPKQALVLLTDCKNRSRLGVFVRELTQLALSVVKGSVPAGPERSKGEACSDLIVQQRVVGASRVIIRDTNCYRSSKQQTAAGEANET